MLTKVGAVIGIHSGLIFSNVEIKFDMIGKYLGEFALTRKPCKHGKAGWSYFYNFIITPVLGIGATKGSAHSDWR